MIIFHNNTRITLANNDFVAEGGEGRVFLKAQTMYKIFHKHPIPMQKIVELSRLSRGNIMSPEDPIYNTNKEYIGFSMSKAPSSLVVCQLFTNTFWAKNKITTDSILKLVNCIRETIEYIHKKGFLLVDLNEFNFLVNDHNYTDAYFIDTDSYQNENYPATAIMSSIRDWTTDKFTPETDWFSFAILACQLFIGMHPFKGKHPNFDKKDIRKRITSNVSIFNKDTKVPQSTRDFSHIPAIYKHWFEGLFEKGQRCLPPVEGVVVNVATLSPRQVTKTTNIVIKILKEYVENITGFYSNDINMDVVHGKECLVFINNSKLRFIIDRGQLHCKDSQEVTNIKSSNIFVSDNKLFTVNSGKVMEIYINTVNGKLIISPKSTSLWQILPHASKIMDGLIYQDVLGSPHLSFFYQNNGKTCQWIKQIIELKGHKIIDGKYENRVCFVVTHKDGVYHEFIFKIDERFNNYACAITPDIDNQEVNFIVIPKGVAIILEDKQIRVFNNNQSSNKETIIHDDSLDTNMRICHNGNNVILSLDNKLYSMRMGRSKNV